MSIDHSQVRQTNTGVTAPMNGTREYKSPGLVCYGSVSVLTQAALTGNAEGSEMSNPNMATGSDMRLKQDIARVGNHPLGFGLYLFDYKPEFRVQHGEGRQFGVMAQEVEIVMPSAVVTCADGYKRVKYDMLGINLSGRGFH